MSKIFQIVKGWGNVIKQEIGVLEEDIEKMSIERLEVCNKCLLRSGVMCSTTKSGKNLRTGQITTGCGCVLIAKTKVKEAMCPLNKW